MWLFCLLLLVTDFINGDPCNNEACQNAKTEIYEIMNKTADPCEDFSEYACGNFGNKFKILPGESSAAIFSQIHTEIMQDLKALIETENGAHGNSIEAKAIHFYESCMNIHARDRRSHQSIINAVKQLDKVNGFEEKFGELTKTSLGSNLFGLGLDPDSKSPSNYILSLNTPSLILDDSTLQKPDDPDNKKVFDTIKITMNKSFGILGIMKDKLKLIDEVIQLNIKIAQALPSIEDQSNPALYYNKMTIGELKSKCSTFDWIKALNHIYSDIGHKFSDKDKLTVFSLPYLDKICKIIEEYRSEEKSQIMELDFAWSPIKSLAKYGSSKLVRLFDELKAVTYGIKGKQEQWKICISTTGEFLQNIIGNMYVKNKFQPSMKKDIENLVIMLKDSLKRVIEEINWMDSETRKKALEKLSTIKQKIGYPDSILNDTKIAEFYKTYNPNRNSFVQNIINSKKLDAKAALNNYGKKIPSDLWYMPPHEVNAYYNPTSNEIVFPASILRSPFYDADLPLTMKFAGIGSVIGHEVLHGFDTQGAQYDKDGLLKNWWAKETKEKYEEKAQCIIDQYGHYKMYGVNLPSKQTIGEDIADNAGIRMAFKSAMHKMVNDGSQKLDGSDLNPEQLFFLRYARLWCAVYKKEALLNKMKSDVHTVWKYRINGPVSNMPEFSKAFNCKSGQKMNHGKNKCLVW